MKITYKRKKEVMFREIIFNSIFEIKDIPGVWIKLPLRPNYMEFNPLFNALQLSCDFEHDYIYLDDSARVTVLNDVELIIHD